MDLQKLSARSDEAFAFFCRQLGALDHIFLTVYRLSEEEAGKVAEGVCDWFEQYVVRRGVAQISVKNLRLALLTAACRAACMWQLGKFDGKAPADEELKETLGVYPDTVALGIDKELEMGLLKLPEVQG